MKGFIRVQSAENGPENGTESGNVDHLSHVEFPHGHLNEVHTVLLSFDGSDARGVGSEDPFHQTAVYEIATDEQRHTEYEIHSPGHTSSDADIRVRAECPALHAGLCSHQGGRKNDTVNYYCQVAILTLGAGGGLLRELFLFVLSPADTACTGETARLFRLWKSRVSSPRKFLDGENSGRLSRSMRTGSEEGFGENPAVLGITGRDRRAACFGAE